MNRLASYRLRLSRTPGALAVRRAYARVMSGTRGRVLDLALPAVGEQLLHMAVGMTNTYMVGHLGAASLTAVGLGDQVVMLLSGFLAAVATGSTVLVARCIGAKDPQTASRALQQSMLLGLAMGILFTVVGYSLSSSAMRWLGAAPDVIPLGTSYLRIVSLSYGMMALLFIGNGALRGAGDTRSPLVVMGIVNAVNILVSLAFLNGWGPLPVLGVRGPALGSAVGRTLGSVLIVSALLKGRAGLRFIPAELRHVDWALLGRILNVGVPTGVETVLMRFGQLSFSTIVAGLGTVAYAAHQIAMTSMSASFMPGFGFGIATTTLVGQRLGAKDVTGAKECCREASRVAVLVMSAVGLFMVLFARQVMGVFINDPEVIELGVPCLRLLGFVQPFLMGMHIYSGALKGAGDTRATMVITTASIWLLRLPLGYLFATVLRWGLTGVWIALAVDQIMRTALYWLRYRAGRWERMKV
ncbi:MAG: MATE family efflux transporter [Chloroflexi bacterium]|nr:MATE family efflux transporter [Chloroflexota bacterium]